MKLLLALIIVVLPLNLVRAQAPRGVEINNLKVLSNHIDDVTTPENIIKSFVKLEMTQELRAKALWTAAVKYRHQTAPPNEFIAADNVYGYAMCCCCSSLIECLNRLDGRETRGRILNGHSVAETYYDKTWHMFDPSLINYFSMDNGSVAGVNDISAAINTWYVQHPEYKGNTSKLDEFMRSDGWMGYKKGPELLAHCSYYNMGWWPAKTHGWNNTMQEYAGQPGFYDYGYQVGHRALFSLRPGESLERDAGNHGLHVNMDADPGFVSLNSRAPKGDLEYLKQFMPEYNGGVVGNGYHRYAPNLALNQLAEGAEVYENLVTDKSQSVYILKAGKPGLAVIRMGSPYVYLGGRVNISAFCVGSKDSVKLSISTNNCRSWSPIWRTDKVGLNTKTVDIKDNVYRRYAYWLKLEFAQSSSHGAQLNSFSIENDIQHAPRTLAWLGKGANTITVDADTNTDIATRSVVCRITPDTTFKKNESSSSMGFVFENVDVRDDGAWWKEDTGKMVVPFEAPGDIKQLRYSAHVRVRDSKDLVAISVSFDDGKSWKDAGKIIGPYPGITKSFIYSDIPKGARKGMLKFEMTCRNTVGIFDMRLDADYHDPLAKSKFFPFTVEHKWKEAGAKKSYIATVNKLPYTYKIVTKDEPEMLSVTCSMK